MAVLTVSSLSLLISNPEEAAAYTPHAPIFIDGDANFIVANGVVSGAGTQSDPFVIEGWEIIPSASGAILIQNTTLHFVIRGVYVHDGGSGFDGHDGIRLVNVINGRVDSALVLINHSGILINSSSNIIVFNSNVSGNYYGVRIESSHDITVTNGSYWNNDQAAVNPISSQRITIARNLMSDTGTGTNTHVFVVTCTSIIIEENEISDTDYGIYLWESGSVEVRRNFIHGNRDYGIKDYMSSDFRIYENRVELNGRWAPMAFGGIILFGSSRGEVFRNNISGNYIGVGLERTSEFGPTTKYMDVHHNNFTGNTIQGQDQDGWQNLWDEGYLYGGNYWDDYTGIDEKWGPYQDQPGADGVGDTPYKTSLGGQDRYPLMRPGGIVNSPPIARFGVTPPSGTLNTVFQLDASDVYDYQDSDSELEVHWDWEDDGTWDTPWSSTKTAQHQYTAFGSYTINLEVKDTGGLTGNTTRTVWVNNTPPVAAFIFTPTPPNAPPYSIGVDASPSTDLEDPVDSLSVRWDWEDDGIWDTSWSTWKSADYQCPAPGTYTIRLEVRDTGGLVGTTTRQVEMIDVVPPVVAHTPHEDVMKGDEIVITANVTDDAGVKAVYLHYKVVGAPIFIGIRMMKTTGDTYEATIPAQSEPGTVYYFINATDEAGNEARHPRMGEHHLQIVEKENPPLTGMIPIVTIVIAAIAALVVVAIVTAILLFLKRRRRIDDSDRRAEERMKKEKASESPPKSPD